MTARALHRRLLNRLRRRWLALLSICLAPDGPYLLGKGRRWPSLWPGHSQWAAAVATEGRLALVQITALGASPIGRHLLPPRTVLYHPYLTSARRMVLLPGPRILRSAHCTEESAASCCCTLKVAHELTLRLGPNRGQGRRMGQTGQQWVEVQRPIRYNVTQWRTPACTSTS